MAGQLEQYEILLGVSGGIAAFKTAQLCSALVKAQAGVSVAMTEHAQRFVGPLTFSTLTGRPVYTDLFQQESVYDAEHIRLTARADLIVVAPATANLIAKTASGICDDLLSTLLCSAESPILFAPAMNQRMWENPATTKNIQTLQDWGVHIIGPESGRLACGEEGIGRMSESEVIFQRILDILKKIPPKQITS